jgi:Helicase conserved C-terminal domain
LDPHRFARGIKPTKEATREVTVRRLKQDLVDDEGKPRFPRRKVVMLEVEHPDSERAVHADLVAYGAARAKRLGHDPSATAAADFVVTLLKKRLFSSPAAFLRTLEVHRGTISRERGPVSRPTPTVLQRLFDDAAVAIDGEAAEDGVGEAAREAIEAAAATEQSRPTSEEFALLDRMTKWAGQEAVREDARTIRLLDWVQENVKPGSRFTDRRVIVFSEYRATQRYLQERLSARGIAGARVELLDGSTTEEERERIKSQWQEPPSDFPVRVLLATDAASEGISLQRQCHLLAHAEIPWNPNRLEQRNGRIDRHGQPAAEVLVHHCVSAGWETGGRGSLEGDLDFLARGGEGGADSGGPRERGPGDRRPDRGGDARSPSHVRREPADGRRSVAGAARAGAADARAACGPPRRSVREPDDASPRARAGGARRCDGACARTAASAHARTGGRDVDRARADWQLVARSDRA